MDLNIFYWHALGILITLVFSRIVPMILKAYHVNPYSLDQKKRKQSQLIGFCEIILVYLFIIRGEVTGLGLIFAAKALARNDDNKEESVQTYFLAGTLVNFTYAILMASFFKANEMQWTTWIYSVFSH